MNIFKTSYYTACSLLPMAFLKTIGPSTTLFPYHHTVSNEFLPHIKHLYNYKNVNQFSSDLDFLLRHYRPVTLTDIIKSIQEHSTLPKRSFFLSFDDGFREIHDIIAPILEKKGIPACFFINPAFIDNYELFYRCKISLLIDELIKNKDNRSFLHLLHDLPEIKKKSVKETIDFLKTINTSAALLPGKIAEKIGFSFDSFLKTKQPYLTRGQLKSLHERGFHIGAHSFNHPYFQHISIPEQIEQVSGSCRYVNELLNINDCCFSFPHSDRGLLQALFNEISKLKIPLLFGIQNQKMELENKMLHRFNAERPDINFASQIKGIMLMICLRKLTGRNKVTRN
jgi:peptidoglycan/xylan/chitin deacetylase (PgdA/CDA1 family)